MAVAVDEGQVKFADLSGLVVEAGDNPYAGFIQACGDDSRRIQEAYQNHRRARNDAQRAQLLSPEFGQLSIDPILSKLDNPRLHPGYEDPRHCLVLWARPPNHVLGLAAKIQARLKQASPNIWLLPTHRMHMTCLEVAFSRTPDEIEDLTGQIRPHLPAVVSLTTLNRRRRAHLVRPMVSFDVSAFALSFVPATADVTATHEQPDAVNTGSAGGGGGVYTYHHLRRDLYEAVKGTGIEIQSRYQVPSAHITLGRFLVQDDHQTPVQRENWVEAIDEVNRWLETEVWDTKDGEWIVGQERGLEARCGALWYGGGRTLLAGEGF